MRRHGYQKNNDNVVPSGFHRRYLIVVMILCVSLPLAGGCVPVTGEEGTDEVLLPEGEEGGETGEGGEGGEEAPEIPEECQVPATVRTSVDDSDDEANGASQGNAISADGRFIAFASDAADLVPGDVNAASDVFVRDRSTGLTSRVSVDSNGNEASGDSMTPAISADGRWVAFVSNAADLDLLQVDANGVEDIFLHDRNTGSTIRVSLDSNGVEANNANFEPAVSADGRFVAFISLATNLDLVVADANGVGDVFVHDRQTGDTERVSFQPDGTEWPNASFGPDINADMTGAVDGNFVSYSIGATGVFLRDRQAAITEKISVDSDENDGDGDSEHAAISGDGRFVAFRSTSTDFDQVQPDTNATADIFVRDRQAGTTIRVSLDSNGVEANGFCGEPAISGDGRFVGFQSAADNLDLVTADTNGARDFFLHDCDTGVTERVSLTEAGNEGGGDIGPVRIAINGDGRFLTFSSEADDLVPSDNNAAVDVFVRARCAAP